MIYQYQFEFVNLLHSILAGMYLFKVKHGNTRSMCEVCRKLKIKIPERRQ